MKHLISVCDDCKYNSKCPDAYRSASEFCTGFIEESEESLEDAEDE